MNISLSSLTRGLPQNDSNNNSIYISDDNISLPKLLPPQKKASNLPSIHFLECLSNTKNKTDYSSSPGLLDISSLFQQINDNLFQKMVANTNLKSENQNLDALSTPIQNSVINNNNNILKKNVKSSNMIKTPQLCLHNQKSRVPFTNEEDEKIKKLTEKFGTRNWPLIASFIEGRTPKQCRDRYSNYLIPGFFQGQWTKEEDELLTKLYIQNGPKWSFLQKSFPSRSANSIKNRWQYFLLRQDKNVKS